jgi:hypothetical protein
VDAERKAIASKCGGDANPSGFQPLPQWPFGEKLASAGFTGQIIAGRKMRRFGTSGETAPTPPNAVTFGEAELIEIYRGEDGLIIRQRTAADRPSNDDRFVVLNADCALRVLSLLREVCRGEGLVPPTD